ncbi:NusB antitermination factor [Flavobacterium croceum DSM 17960]|uniref:NusB antitermination factor n=2 Tax=Flavobacterium TaxID=237 RepID=A0A2S4NAP4_9FLAO|nr:NusB antitermination factor [Flavobacterium croceum DSM 17960]
MLNRRHIRVKAMQSIYAMHQSGHDSLEKQEKFLLSSLENVYELYLVILSSLIELRKKELDFLELSKNKHLATAQDKNPNLKFVDNAVLVLLSEDNKLEQLLEDRKISNWQRNDDTILLLLQDIKQSDIYLNYMNSGKKSFEEDRDFLVELFSEVIAPNDKLYDYLEDYKLTWVDDIPLVNTEIAKQLKQLEEDKFFRISKLYKDTEDKEFAVAIFRKTVLNEATLEKEFIDKTPNWEVERIAELDTIILKMAICEFLKFPSIPVKVTINEYLEIAKEYSTPKSSIFINGILDHLVKEYQNNNKLQKVGRGLL